MGGTYTKKIQDDTTTNGSSNSLQLLLKKCLFFCNFSRKKKCQNLLKAHTKHIVSFEEKKKYTTHLPLTHTTSIYFEDDFLFFVYWLKEFTRVMQKIRGFEWGFYEVVFVFFFVFAFFLALCP